MTVGTRLLIEDDKLIAVRSQDCEAILENATARRNEGIHGDPEMRHAASFPAVVVEAYINEHGITFQDFLKDPEHAKRMMRDPALAYFRIWEGAV